MRLIGILRSPYVRRTAVSLNAMEIPFMLDAVPVFDKPELVTPHNPLTRVPTLVLEGGEALIDSAIILDYLDELAGPEKRLVPERGAERRHVLKLTTIALGAVSERVQEEGDRGPDHKWQQDVVEQPHQPQKQQ